MDTESKEVDLKAVKQAAMHRKEEVVMRTVKMIVPAEMANHIENAKMRGRYLLTISYSNSQETLLYHRYCRKSFSLKDSLTAIEGIAGDLLEEYEKENQDE